MRVVIGTIEAGVAGDSVWFLAVVKKAVSQVCTWHPDRSSGLKGRPAELAASRPRLQVKRTLIIQDLICYGGSYIRGH